MAFIKPGNRIYHYCKLSTAIELILPKFQLLLNNIKNTNDPREYKEFVFAQRYLSTNDFNLSNTDRQVSDLLREDCKVLCFSLDHKHFWGYAYANMWAHYGDNHQGVCLELDKAEFIDENKEKIRRKNFQKIKYYEFNIKKPVEHKIVDLTKIKNNNIEDYVKNEFRDKNLKYIYFTKNKEWQPERELRLIYFSHNIENEYCSIRKSLKNIHFGLDFKPQYIPAISKLIPDKDLYQMKYGDVGLISHQLILK